MDTQSVFENLSDTDKEMLKVAFKQLENIFSGLKSEFEDGVKKEEKEKGVFARAGGRVKARFGTPVAMMSVGDILEAAGYVVVSAALFGLTVYALEEVAIRMGWASKGLLFHKAVTTVPSLPVA